MRGPQGTGGTLETVALPTGLDAETILPLLDELIRAGGGNPGASEEATVAVLTRALTEAGADVELDEVAPGRCNVVATFGAGEGGVLFLGHSDVVPAGTGWTGEPFEPRHEGTAVIGRGTTDMKGGLAAVVAAAAAVHRERPEVPITVLCTVDEEVDARGALHHIAHRPPTPHALCVVAEPTGMTAITGCRGAANLRLTVTGASAHAGRPADGANAILAAADIVALVEEDARRLAADPHPVLGSATWNVGTIEGGHGTSIVADRCVLTLDRRLLPGEDAEEILQDLLTRARRRIAAAERPGAARIAVEGEVEMSMPGFSLAPDSPQLEAVRAAVRDAGGPGEVGIWTASCEGGFVARHHDVPTLVLGPGDLPGQAHQPDESVEVAELVMAAHTYALLILRSIPPADALGRPRKEMP